MDSKDLRKMKRLELLELMESQSREIDRLNKEVESLKDEVVNKTRLLENALVSKEDVEKMREKENTEYKSKISKLEEDNKCLKKELNDRKIALSEAGNIAEATLVLNNIFENAQRAADEYVKNVESACSESMASYEAREKELEEKIAQRIKSTKDECERIKADTDKEVKAKWSEFNSRVSKFVNAREDLKVLFERMG